MITLHGCVIGRKYAYGKNPRVTLDLRRAQESRRISVGTRLVSIDTDEHLLILWHRRHKWSWWRLYDGDDDGTWHGFYDPAALRQHPYTDWDAHTYGIHPCETIIPDRSIWSRGKQHGVIAVAAVIVVPLQGLCWVTSGFRGSGRWTVHQLEQGCELQSCSLDDLREHQSVVQL
jgi:hypothetical protein